ncbi:putative sec8 exocyst complex component specific domain-containing protein [Phaeoacremonium minimum UCRPA7]|uniref:Exocyst complex component Sec8 n=1 Tax=Phaeoacremonium minimum (strain UCR-PA7) TaxID=1286976 RepID=R8BBH2_PHAM7|nr:putative sec8 exocyst complex component specific domain-containing protein [Phaeoacremonium minimum UCRPA7]EON96683.1 putative sec8 exocyst complex component specific domain-containing protein [Phaeoacremonium minimum UCRPA7]
MSYRNERTYRNGNGTSNGYGNFGRQRGGEDDYDPFGEGYSSDRYGTPPPQARPPPRAAARRAAEQQQQLPTRERGYETNAEKQIGQVLEHIKSEWPAMCQTDCVPVQLALQLLDSSSVGRAHEYRQFQKTHTYLQDSLKGIVHDYHQGFNSSIGTFHKIQGSIQASQRKVRALKDGLAASRTSLCATDPELKKLYNTSQMYDDLLQTLGELEELRGVPDQLEARISEKRFLTAVEVLQNALRKLRKPELDNIGALSELRSYLANQETALMDILVEELHEHLYLKSPYCQERWQNLSKHQGAFNDAYSDNSALVPFFTVLDSMDFENPVQEDPARNPESDTFYYISLLVESLNKLGRLETAVDTLKQRLPVELFGIVNETINEIDQKHPSSLRGVSSGTHGLHIYGSRETQMRADVIYDLLWTLYGKFEAIAEGHRLFHEYIKALIRREGAGNNSALLGSFKELWNLYQNEIRSLLHNYVTTDADVYQFNSPRPGGGINGKMDVSRDHLFRFSEADSKSVEMVTEYEALDGIIRAAVPGLTANQRKGQGTDKKASLIGKDPIGSRKSMGPSFDNRNQKDGTYKSLVEPSVFNMSLLLPPTLVFLQRLKSIVPPGSDLATSTLTSFLDNFLVNVFQPQLDETLGKLSDTVFGEADAFQQDSDWVHVARKPIFKGTTSFFAVVAAFCRMLGTIPHDQALSALIITQMMRYYDRCFGWYKTLVTKTQENASEPQSLRASAVMASDSSEINETMKKLWSSENLDLNLLEKEVALLITQTNEKALEMSDIISDRDTISSLCLLYTSMKWLAVKVQGLRHITRQDADSSRSSLPKPEKRRWTLLNDPNKATAEDGPVYLPMTQETVQSFDGIVSSYEELAATALLTLHMEARCRIVYSLHVVLSPLTAPYILEQDVNEPDPQVLSLNSELVSYDETVVRFLREREASFIRTGFGLLINSYLVSNAPMTSPMNAKGCGRMQLNILVLQQNLKNIEAGVDLARAANYFALFDKGPDAIVAKAKEDSGKEGGSDPDRFTYDELKALVELCYSEQLADPERGIAAQAKRQMADKMLQLSEHMWQS